MLLVISWFYERFEFIPEWNLNDNFFLLLLLWLWWVILKFNAWESIMQTMLSIHILVLLKQQQREKNTFTNNTTVLVSFNTQRAIEFYYKKNDYLFLWFWFNWCKLTTRFSLNNSYGPAWRSSSIRNRNEIYRKSIGSLCFWVWNLRWKRSNEFWTTFFFS